MIWGGSTLDRFRILHSEIIEYYQCIEFDIPSMDGGRNKIYGFGRYKTDYKRF